MTASIKFLYDLKSEATQQLNVEQLTSVIINGTGTVLGLYDGTKTYSKGNKTAYIDSDGVVHILICTSASTTGSPITAGDWDEYSILSEIEKLKNDYVVVATTQPTSRVNNIWVQNKSTDTDGVAHGIYSYNTTLGTNTNTYAKVYLKNSLADVDISKFTSVTDLDAIPTTNYSTGTLKDLVQNLDASIRKLDRDKYAASNVTTTATANKVLALDSNAQLPATAARAVSDNAGNNINTTYIKALAVTDDTITYTKGDGSTGTVTVANTDTMVTNTLNTTTKAYITGTTSATTNTGTQIFDTGVYLGTTAGTLYATTFNGNLTGTASNATSDASGNNIVNTYATKTAVAAKANTADLATVATSGSYADLNNKPTIPTAVSQLTNDSGYLTNASALAASKISGTISIDNLPKGALERLVKVTNLAAMYALTTDNVQLGDTVKLTSDGSMYIVVDEANLGNANGYEQYTAGAASSVPWSGITDKPTTFTPSAHTQAASTITGLATVATSGSYTDLNNKPTIPTTTSQLTNDSGYVKNTDKIAAASLADNATALATARTIGLSGVTATAQSFDGTANITIPITAVPATLLTGTASISTTGNAATATKATGDSAGNNIVNTYSTKANTISNLTISGRTITYTKADASTGTLTTQDTTYSVFTGASGSANGTTGLVPAPTAGNNTSFLRGDGTWVVPTNTDTMVTNTLATGTKAYVTGTTSAATNTGTQIFDTGVYIGTTAGSLYATTFYGGLSGNATTATTLATARTIGLSGVTATAQSFNGSEAITIPITAIPGTLLTGSTTISTSGNAATATKATQDASGNVITSTYINNETLYRMRQKLQLDYFSDLLMKSNTLGRIYRIKIDGATGTAISATTSNLLSGATISVNNSSAAINKLAFNADMDISYVSDGDFSYFSDVTATISYTVTVNSTSKTFSITDSILNLNRTAYAIDYSTFTVTSSSVITVAITSLIITPGSTFNSSTNLMRLYDVLLATL